MAILPILLYFALRKKARIMLLAQITAQIKATAAVFPAAVDDFIHWDSLAER
jgi:hypothetical protein